MSLRIGLLGPIPKDTITTHRGEKIKKYGGVIHPTIGLSKLLTEKDSLVPVAHINKEDEEAIFKLLKQYSNIELTHISSEHNQGSVVQLVFLNQNDREETQTGAMRPIVSSDLQGVDCSVYVCVPITDYEVPLKTLMAIKSTSDSLIIFDAHGPTTQVDDKGNRLRVHWLDMIDWLPYIDVLKMNLEESQYCYFPPDKIQNYDPLQRDHLDSFAKIVLEAGVKHLFVTLDSEGCQWFTKEGGKINSVFIQAYPVDNVVDTTGCGDSFAGGLAYGFARYSDPLIAAQFANLLGAMRTQGKTFEVFKDLETTEQMRQTFYGSTDNL
jgi:hypothetical protein